MKKLGLILFAFMAMCACVMAQEQGAGRQRGQRANGMPQFNKEQMVKMMTDRQVERLKLTDEQTAQMKVLNEALITEMMNQRPQMGNPQAFQEMTPEELEKMRKERPGSAQKKKDMNGSRTPRGNKIYHSMSALNFLRLLILFILQTPS